MDGRNVLRAMRLYRMSRSLDRERAEKRTAADVVSRMLHENEDIGRIPLGVHQHAAL